MSSFYEYTYCLINNCLINLLTHWYENFLQFEVYSSSVVIKPDTMVLLHVKRSEESQFLHSCNVMDNVEEVLMKVTYKIFRGLED